MYVVSYIQLLTKHLSSLRSELHASGAIPFQNTTLQKLIMDFLCVCGSQAFSSPVTGVCKSIAGHLKQHGDHAVFKQ